MTDVVKIKPGRAPSIAAEEDEWKFGVIEWFNYDKGFGFIVAQDQHVGEKGNVFLHANVLRAAGWSQIMPGQSIEYMDIADERGRRRAVVVR